MSLALNENSFTGFRERFEAEKAFDLLIDLIRYLNERFDISLGDIFFKHINMLETVAGDLSYAEFVNTIEDRDKRSFILLILQKTGSIQCERAELLINGKEAFGASYAYENDGVMISLRTHKDFFDKYVLCSKDNETAEVRNISDKQHIEEHADHIVVRIYVRNIKHGLRKYLRSGGETVSPMDLPDLTAQHVLNKAVVYENRLFGLHNDQIYCFERTIGCIYHGYRCDDLQKRQKEVILKEICLKACRD